MGNSLPTNQYIYVGINASIQFRRQIHCLEEGKLETWILSYHVGWSVVIFILETTYGEDGFIKLLRFNFYKPGLIEFVIDKAENNLLNQINTRDFERIHVTNFVNETKNQWGGVTKTNIAYCGNENVGNLLVVEEQRKRRVEKPCVVTIAHYYAVSSRSLFGLRKYDVGLSIVAEIRVLNDDLDVSWKGPSEHPSLALFHMFHQISITRTWMWTACSHCADEIQRTQSSGVNRKQFETENDDEEKNYLQRARKTGGNILANQGMIRGNNNGNFFVNQLILRPSRGNYL